MTSTRFATRFAERFSSFHLQLATAGVGCYMKSSIPIAKHSSLRMRGRAAPLDVVDQFSSGKGTHTEMSSPAPSSSLPFGPNEQISTPALPSCSRLR